MVALTSLSPLAERSLLDMALAALPRGAVVWQPPRSSPAASSMTSTSGAQPINERPDATTLPPCRPTKRRWCATRPPPARANPQALRTHRAARLASAGPLAQRRVEAADRGGRAAFLLLGCLRAASGRTASGRTAG